MQTTEAEAGSSEAGSSEAGAAESRTTLSEAIAAVLRMMKHAEPGDLAALRRLRPGDVAAPAFWRLASGVLEDHVRTREDEDRWALVLSAMARLAGLHHGHEPLGRALAEADVAEARVLRLIKAHGTGFAAPLRAAVHMLQSKGIAANQLQLAELVLSDGTPREETIRRQIARDYYAQMNRKEKR